ncbi:MAG: DMT family transporter [Deltaproteobacteria bacterium]|nr:DMT family transporter [Deltaproteobacteria bacterium]MBW1846592.1 DMT family transporter [Deltaproteobacteria bacterium]MBW2365276.1 DMT family transporter [Deltaproteobacteria bacterium]
MQNLLFIFVAVFMGIIMSIYLPMNSSVSKYIGSVYTANITFFLAALFTSIFLFIIFGDFKTIFLLKNVPVYLYLTGFVSAFIVLGTTFLIPHLGARKLFVLVVSGQILMAVIVSHFGILESPRDPVTFKKICGAMLVIFGAYVSSS